MDDSTNDILNAFVVDLIGYGLESYEEDAKRASEAVEEHVRSSDEITRLYSERILGR